MKLSNLLLVTLMELKRIYNDKRRILILILGSIILGLVGGLVAYRSPQEINVAIFVDHFQQSSPFEHEDTRQIIDEIDKSDVFSVSRTYSLHDAMQRLTDRKSRAVIVLREGETSLEAVRVTMDVTDVRIQQVILKELPVILEANSRQAAIDFLSTAGLSSEQVTEIVNPVDISITTNEWKETKYLDFTATPFMILIVLGICLLTSVTAITSERSIGTIERIFASPYKGSEIILSKMLAYSVLAIIVSIMIVFTFKLMFNVALGSPFLVLIITILVGINGIIFGLLVSSMTYSELESVAMGVVFWFLFMILMGFMYPQEAMHPIFRYAASITPYLYGVHAIRQVSLVGWGFPQVWPDLAILSGFITVQALVAILILRREIR